ncbi:homeodomain-interacting protein kinase 1-like [Thalassophryne amazonica]|uniref:homeodomain-interacting protein kinase 1-like n=1 Tax=Thalassophryne amazonica TaxID=390379 RepID=UPI001470EADE|nr:homeodomain-interacting protein kinase 1-like [Thalassophryne amazonica]
MTVCGTLRAAPDSDIAPVKEDEVERQTLSAHVRVTHDAPPAPLPCEVYPGQTLYGSSRYLVLDFIGEGQFGKVAKCNIDTAATVAVKILKKEQAAERELTMLDTIRVLDPVKSCILQFHKCFEDLGRTCMSFEMLDRCLEKLLEDKGWMPLHLKEIRPITQQLLLALESLSGLGLVHSDLKLDNIMLVDQQAEPFRVKLIDFGVAFKVSSIPLGLIVQPLGFRAPEVTLGLPLSQAIDMWGLGCILFHLYLANQLYTADVAAVADLLDTPEDRLISSGVVTQTATAEADDCHTPTWRLKCPDEYEDDGDLEHDLRCLNKLIDVYGIEDNAEYEDRKAFVSLLKQLLQLDARQRTTAARALRHPFVTMSHLKKSSSSYVTESRTLMSVCPEMDPAVGDSEDFSGVSQEPDSSSDGGTFSGGAAAGGTFSGVSRETVSSTGGAAAEERATEPGEQGPNSLDECTCSLNPR